MQINIFGEVYSIVEDSVWFLVLLTNLLKLNKDQQQNVNLQTRSYSGE